jgi:hypothetical protein
MYPYFYDVTAENIFREQGNSDKFAASCRLSFTHAKNYFWKYQCISYKRFDYYFVALFLYIL